MTNSITITDIPVPHGNLSPNCMKGRWAKVDKIKTQRAVSKYTAIAAVMDHDEPQLLNLPWNEVTCQVVWYRKTRRVIDADNALAMLKSTFDGIVDSGVLSDDKDLVHMPIVFRHDKDNPRIEIKLTQHIPGVCPMCGTEDMRR